MERYVDVARNVQVWAEIVPGPPDIEPVLLVMGANTSGLAWPEAFVELLAERHPVIRYDHRDTGRSSNAFDDDPYGVADLASDAIAVLDAFGVARAHVVGMSMGGFVVQLMLLDHPERIATATLFCTGPLTASDGPELPGPSPELLRLWGELEDPRSAASELAFRVEHWRLLNGTGTPFDPAEFRSLEQRVIAHTGDSASRTAHAKLGLEGLDRGAELQAVSTPTLVIEAPEDPCFPPPNAAHLTRALGAGRTVRIPGMGHAINRTVVPPLAAAILTQTSLSRTTD